MRAGDCVTLQGATNSVWVSDFTASAILSFDPENEVLESFPSDKPDAAVRQLNGRPGEV